MTRGTLFIDRAGGNSELTGQVAEMNAVIAFALRQRRLMLVLLLVVFASGIASFIRLNIEAYPDPVPPLVDIVTQNPGQSAEEIERYITIPLEIELSGIPHVTAIRTISLFGLSDVAVQFNYDFTYEEASRWVINRLSRHSLPSGVTPADLVGTARSARYTVTGWSAPGYSLTDLKTIEDWIVERRLRAVPGVIDVTGWGGKNQDLRGHGRSRPAICVWRHRAAGRPGAQQQQQQCRRPDGQFRRAGRRSCAASASFTRSTRSADTMVTSTTGCRCGSRHRERHRRPSAAPRHRRPGRR